MTELRRFRCGHDTAIRRWRNLVKRSQNIMCHLCSNGDNDTIAWDFAVLPSTTTSRDWTSGRPFMNSYISQYTHALQTITFRRYGWRTTPITATLTAALQLQYAFLPILPIFSLRILERPAFTTVDSFDYATVIKLGRSNKACENCHTACIMIRFRPLGFEWGQTIARFLVHFSIF